MSKPSQTFIISGKLDGANQLYSGSWQKKARVKREGKDRVIVALRQHKIKPVASYPVEIEVRCFEPNRRRDIDNILSGASKIILDALQEAGIIDNDNQKCISAIRWPIPQIDERRPRVEVTIKEAERWLASV